MRSKCCCTLRSRDILLLYIAQLNQTATVHCAVVIHSYSTVGSRGILLLQKAQSYYIFTAAKCTIGIDSCGTPSSANILLLSFLMVMDVEAQLYMLECFFLFGTLLFGYVCIWKYSDIIYHNIAYGFRFASWHILGEEVRSLICILCWRRCSWHPCPLLPSEWGPCPSWPPMGPQGRMHNHYNVSHLGPLTVPLSVVEGLSPSLTCMGALGRTKHTSRQQTHHHIHLSLPDITVWWGLGDDTQWTTQASRETFH